MKIIDEIATVQELGDVKDNLTQLIRQNPGEADNCDLYFAGDFFEELTQTTNKIKSNPDLTPDEKANIINRSLGVLARKCIEMMVSDEARGIWNDPQQPVE